MTISIVERQKLHRAIDTLPEAAAERLAHYIEFLCYEARREEQEDTEDIAYVQALTEEDYADSIPMSEVIAEHESKHGPLS